MTRKGWSHANTDSRPGHPRRQRGRRNTFQGPDPGALTASLEGVDPGECKETLLPLAEVVKAVLDGAGNCHRLAPRTRVTLRPSVRQSRERSRAFPQPGRTVSRTAVLGLLRCFGSPALRWSTTKEWDQMKRSKFSEEQVAYALRRITDETREWEVIAPPYSTAGGRIVHARFQRIDQPDSLGDTKLGRFPSAAAWSGRPPRRANNM